MALTGCTNRWVIDYHSATHGHSHSNEQTSYEAIVYTRFWKAVAANNRQQSDLVYRWQGVANCESGGNWATNTGNGYYGGVQFSYATWRSVGGPGYPHQQSAATQAHYAEILKNRSGLGQWPSCGRHYR